jgi:hypothetical protein
VPPMSGAAIEMWSRSTPLNNPPSIMEIWIATIKPSLFGNGRSGGTQMRTEELEPHRRRR